MRDERLDTLRERERGLRRREEEHRMSAPNPRDFPSWEAFYEAQASHEAAAAAIEREIAAVLQEAWS